MRKTWIAAAVAAGALMGLGTAATAAPAVVAVGPAGQVQYSPYAGPPQAMYETVPAPRAGYVWSPGYYRWQGDQYVWQAGNWVERRSGYAWQPARWEQRGDGHWILTEGHWVRTDNYSYRSDDYDRYDRRIGTRGPDGDLDGDGIRNRDDRDRDGDGVRNRDDDFPNDATRS